jgi:hypothetical protein
MASKIESHRVDLQDGRTVRVRAYDDGSVRVQLNGGPYAIAEAFLPGNEHARVKLVPISR